MKKTKAVTIVAALSSITMLGLPLIILADDCDAAFGRWIESQRYGRLVTISGTVNEVYNNVDLNAVPGTRGYNVVFGNACYGAFGFAVEGPGSVSCRVGQKIVVRGTVVDIDIGILIRGRTVRCR